MLINNFRRRCALVPVLGAVVLFIGCGTLSTAASCDDYTEAHETFANPKVTEMVQDAYFEKFSDKTTVSGGTLMENLARVRRGCAIKPGAKIDEFVEVGE